jgi:pilus assembly protein CpaE
VLDVNRTPPDPRDESEASAVALNRPLVIAYVGDAESEGVLRAAMAELGDGLTIERGSITHAVRDLARKATPQVLIVDITGIGDPVVALDDLANVCEPDVKVLVVGDRTDMGFYREITRGLGVVEYLYKPLTRDNVSRLFLPVVHGRTPGAPELIGGRVITVCGAHGGAGTTTIAANLAVQLAEHTRGYVALVDLNLQSGVAGMMLGVKPSAGLRVALEQPDRVDSLFLDRAAVTVSDRLRLIAAEEPFEEVPRPTVGGVSRLMTLLRRRFNYIVVDMPTVADRALLNIYAIAHTRLMVLNPDVVSIRDTARLRSMLTALSGNDKVVMVLNRTGTRGGLTTRMMEKGLLGKVDFQIPEIDKQLMAAMNLGIPAVARCRQYRSSMLRLTREVSGARVGRGRGLFARLFGR